MDRARQAKMIYDATGSPADEARMWQALNDAVEASLPEGAGFAFEMRLLEDIQKDWMQDVERARSPESRPREEPSADVAARPQLEGVTPPAPETPTPTEVRPPLQREPAAPPEAPPTPEAVTPRPAEALQPPRPEPAVTPG